MQQQQHDVRDPTTAQNCTHRPSCTEGMLKMIRRPTQTERNRSTSSTSSTRSCSRSRRSTSNGFAAILLLVVTDGYLPCARCRCIQPRSCIKQKTNTWKTNARTAVLDYCIGLYGTSTYFLHTYSTLRRSFPQTYNRLLAAVLECELYYLMDYSSSTYFLRTFSIPTLLRR